jgi:hypothetical protein
MKIARNQAPLIIIIPMQIYSPHPQIPNNPSMQIAREQTTYCLEIIVRNSIESPSFLLETPKPSFKPHTSTDKTNNPKPRHKKSNNNQRYRTLGHLLFSLLVSLDKSV